MIGVIKQEIDETRLWRGPPRGEIPSIPEPSQNLNMTIEEYHQTVQNPELLPRIDLRNEMLRKVVMVEFEKIPELWAKNYTKQRLALYPLVAIGVYRRTAIVLLCAEVIQIFRSVRNSFRTRLRTAIFNKKILNIEDLENYLWTWEYYPFCRFLRFATHKWELELRRKMLMDPDGNHVVIDIEEDDFDKDLCSIENAGYVQRRQLNRANEPSTSQASEEADGTNFDFSTPGGHSSHQGPSVSIKQEPGQSLPVAQNSVNSNTASRKRRRPLEGQNNDGNTPRRSQQENQPPPQNDLMSDFNVDLNEITQQARRNLRNEPHRYRELRAALFDLVIHFGSYDNMGDLFRELARRNERQQ